MPLGVVAEVVAHGGYLPQLAELNKKRTLFTKKNGVFAGVLWFIVLTMFLTAFFGILNAPEEFIGILAITGVFGAMIIVIASLVFLPSSRVKFPDFQGDRLPGGLGGAHLSASPPQQSYPASHFAAPQTGSWRDTNDLQPTSVTESTTKLLDHDQQDIR
jgi:hypothetical protein